MQFTVTMWFRHTNKRAKNKKGQAWENSLSISIHVCCEARPWPLSHNGDTLSKIENSLEK